MKLENYPLLKLLFPFIIGIIFSYFIDFKEDIKAFLIIFSCISILIAIVLSLFKSYKFEKIQFFSVFLSYLMLGIVVTNNKYLKVDTDFSKKDTYIVRLLSDGTIKEKSIKFEAEVFNNEDVKGKILLYLKPSELVKELVYGDVLFINTELSAIKPPNNPDAFDNQKYMRRRGVYYTGFVRDDGWRKVDFNPKSRVKYLAQNIRLRLTNIYAESGMTGEEFSILKAILLGDDDTLEPELKKSYSAAGVSHILCVSGMHVGIIFMIINFLLRPLDVFKSTKIAKTIIVTLIIWLYANITGLAPSVSRSATMFTFVAIGQILQRNTNVFHSLFASIFILLMINPLLLFEVGFQLSYLAVFGIVLFQPKIAGIYKCKTKIGNYFWELMSVSISAQLGTSPISMYYFSQFPNYFILSNLCVVALSFVVVITGVMLLPASIIPVIAKFIAKILSFEIKIMNKIIIFIENLPFSVTENINYHIAQMILLYFVIAFLCVFVYHRKKKYFWILSICFTLFCISFPIKKAIFHSKSESIVYQINRGSAIEFTSCGKSVIFSDTIININDKLYQHNIKNHDKKNLIKPEIISIDTSNFQNNYLLKVGNFIRFTDRTYLIADNKYRAEIIDSKITIDCLILRQNCRISPKELLKKIVVKEIYIDGSNSKYYAEKWKNYCMENKIKMIITNERR